MAILPRFISSLLAQTHRPRSGSVNPKQPVPSSPTPTDQPDYRQLLDGMSDGYFLLQDGAVLMANARAAELAGRSTNALIGRPFTDMLAADDRTRTVEALGKAVQGGVVPLPFAAQILRNDGSTLAVELAWRTIEYRGNPSLAVTMRDVAEHSKTEEALSESEARYHRLAEDVQDIVYRCRLSPSFAVEYVSPAVRTVTGYGPEEFYADANILFRIVHPDDHALLKRGLSQPETADNSTELRWIHRDGRSFWLESRNAFVYDSSGKPAFIEGVARDITAQRLAQEALRKSQAGLAMAQRQARIGSWELDLTTGTATCSDELLLLAGRDPSLGAPTFQEFMETIHPDDRSEVAARMQDRVQEGGTGKFEFRFTTPGRPEMWVLGTAAAVRNASGQVSGLFGTLQDITERKQAEEAVQKSEALYRALVSASPDVVAMVGMDGLISYASPQVTPLFGYQDDHEIIGRSPLDLVAAEDRERARANIAEVFRGGLVGHNEYRLTRKEGEAIWCELNSSLVKDGTGKPVGLVAIIRDISERKRAQQALTLIENRYRSVFTQSKDAIIITSTDGEIIDINPAGVEMLGYAGDELIGATMRQLLANPADRDEFRRLVAERGFVRDLEMRFRTKDGVVLDCLTTATPRMSETGETVGYQGIIRDVTVHKRMEIALQEANEDLRVAQHLTRIGNWKWNLATNTVTWSDELCRINGWDPKRPIPSFAEMSSFYTPESWKRLNIAVTDAINNGDPYEIELDSIRTDGTVRRTAARGAADHDASGNIAGLHGTVQDITERKQAEEALASSEERYRTIFESAAEAILVTDVETRRFKYANLAAEKLFGWSREQLSQMRAGELSPTARKEVNIQLFEEFANKGQEETIVLELQRRDGGVIYASYNSARVAIGGRQHLVGYFTDVTSQREGEQARLRLQQAVESSSEVVFMTDPDGTITYVNREFTRLYGYGADEVVGKVTPRVLKSGTLSPQVYHAFWQAILAGQVVRGELTNRTKAGVLVEIDSTTNAIKDEEGRVTAFLAIQKDITARKATEAALAKSQASLIEAQRVARLGSWESDISTGTTTWSEEMYRMLAVDPTKPNPTLEDVLGMVHPEDRPMLIARYARVRQTGERASVEYRTDPAGGPTRTLFATSEGIRDSEGRVARLVGTLQDITEQKRAENELRETNRRLEEALAELRHTQQQAAQQERLKALGTMAGGIAHDFNNALTGIMGLSELMLLHPDILKDMEKTHRYVETIFSASKDAAQIVRRLREFYRPRDESEPMAPTNLNHVAEQAVSLLRTKWESQAQAAGISISVNVESKPVPMVLGVESELREAVINLILNALDAMPAGGTITISTHEEGSRVALRVRDTGIGMTNEIREHCLEPFFTTKGKQGTGLGLALVHGIVTRHLGDIAIESEVGKGTAVTLSLPTSTGRERDAGADSITSATDQISILVVDDEPLAREVLAAHLASARHLVEIAEAGGEALQKLRRGGFDLVITDRAMPGVSGDQLAAAVKAISPALPVILLTGFGDMMNAAGELPPGVDLVLAKPITGEMLRQAVKRLTGKRPPS